MSIYTSSAVKVVDLDRRMMYVSHPMARATRKLKRGGPYGRTYHKDFLARQAYLNPKRSSRRSLTVGDHGLNRRPNIRARVGAARRLTPRARELLSLELQLQPWKGQLSNQEMAAELGPKAAAAGGLMKLPYAILEGPSE